jgi:hypothetical protein
MKTKHTASAILLKKFSLVKGVIDDISERFPTLKDDMLKLVDLVGDLSSESDTLDANINKAVDNFKSIDAEAKSAFLKIVAHANGTRKILDAIIVVLSSIRVWMDPKSAVSSKDLIAQHSNTTRL